METTNLVNKDTAVTQAQVIICKCGAHFAACREPECYADADWHKEMRKYIKEGCTVQMMDCKSFSFEMCACKKSQVSLFN